MESHTQLPLEHRWPAAQARPVPHAHAPPTQESETFESQARQEAPLVPQVPKPDVVHVWPAQHPFGQEVASHTH